MLLATVFLSQSSGAILVNSRPKALVKNELPISHVTYFVAEFQLPQR